MKTRAALVLVAAACMIPVVGLSADKPGAKYTATGSLRISRQTPFIIFPPAHQIPNRSSRPTREPKSSL